MGFNLLVNAAWPLQSAMENCSDKQSQLKPPYVALYSSSLTGPGSSETGALQEIKQRQQEFEERAKAEAVGTWAWDARTSIHKSRKGAPIKRGRWLTKRLLFRSHLGFSAVYLISQGIFLLGFDASTRAGVARA